MRTSIAFLVALVATLAGAARGEEPEVAPAPSLPRPARPESLNPDYVARQVLYDMVSHVYWHASRGRTDADREALRAEALAQVCHWRYVSWHAMPEDALANQADAVRVWRHWANHLHFATAPVPFRVVPGTSLVRFDLREPDWSPEAWSEVVRKVARGRPMFSEPTVYPEVAAALRELTRTEQDPRSFAVEAVTWGPELFRDTVEGGRSQAYYNLLYSHQRFVVAGATEVRDPAYAPHKDQTTYKGWFTKDGGATWVEEAKVPKVKVTRPSRTPNGFPKDEDDWDSIFKRVDGKQPAVVLGRPVRVVNAAIVQGFNENLRGGSGVIRNGRLLVAANGQFFKYTKTYDNAASTGNKDFLEQAVEIALAFGEPREFDAQELIAGTPCGADAYQLGNDKETRVEEAAGAVARGVPPTKKQHATIHYPNVRNPGDCYRCHAAADGFIKPKNHIDEAFEKKAVVRFKDPADELQFNGVYKNWMGLIPGWQAPYARLRVATTATGPDPKTAWTAVEAVTKFENLWDWYDRPVDADQAARELGVPVLVLKRMAVEDNIFGRPKLLALGQAQPRSSWEADIRPLLADVLAARRQALHKPEVPKP